MPNGTRNVNEFRHMVPKPIVISEANIGIESREFTQQELKIATNGLHNTSNGTERFKAYSQDGYELRYFSYQALTEATRGFSEDNCLGEGPLGQVYEGTLNGEKLTIKKFNNSRKQEEEYKKMKAIGSNVHHRNLVNLIGCCEEGANRLLVYEFVQQDKSLGYYLFDESSNLNWSAKYKICVDAVEIVNDLLRSDKCWWKSNQDWMDNFFLDDDFQPKYAEYGREKFLSDFAATRTSTRLFPNLEELSPEAIMFLLARD